MSHIDKSSHTSNVTSRINDITCITYDMFTRLKRTSLRRHGVGNSSEHRIAFIELLVEKQSAALWYVNMSKETHIYEKRPINMIYKVPDTAPDCFYRVAPKKM